MANAFGERAVLKLMYAALIRASETWRGVQVNPFELKQLEAVGAELDAEHERRHAPIQTKSEAVSPSRKSRIGLDQVGIGVVVEPGSTSSDVSHIEKSEFARPYTQLG